VINTDLFFFCVCKFFNSVTILCAFRVNYSPPQISLMWGYETFKNMNFAHVFLFIIYDVYVATFSTLIK
jgi:hypothetical protein